MLFRRNQRLLSLIGLCAVLLVLVILAAAVIIKQSITYTGNMFLVKVVTCTNDPSLLTKINKYLPFVTSVVPKYKYEEDNPSSDPHTVYLLLSTSTFEKINYELTYHDLLALDGVKELP